MPANSDGAGYAPMPLADALEQDLARRTVREWLSPRHRQALRDPEGDPPAALGVLGRLIRSGDLSRGARQRMDEWWRAASQDRETCDAIVASLEGTALSLAASAKALLASPLTPSSLHALVDQRDRAETALVVLGYAALCEVAGAAESERKVAAELRALDGDARAREGELADAISAAPGPEDAWLARLVRLDDAPWWCDLLVARDLRKRGFFERED